MKIYVSEYGKDGFFMEQNIEYRQQLVREYKRMVSPLLAYLPWLVQNAGQPGSTAYRSKSPLMEKNYSYTYTRNRIRNHDDERRVIQAANIKDWDILRGILSKYVLGGRTKAALWSEAVRENIFALVLEKMRKIIEYWDKPMDDEAR